MEPLLTVLLTFLTVAVALNCLATVFLALTRNGKPLDAPTALRTLFPSPRKGRHKPRALSDEDAWAREQKETRERV